MGGDNELGSTFDNRLPEKGPTTGSIIGGIIGVILLVAIIGTAVVMYRKHMENKLNGEGPPKHKPPPPKKTNSSANKPLNTTHAPVTEDRPLQSEHHNTQNAEPVTDLDAYYDDEDYGEDDRAHYYSAAPSGWDDPGNNDVPPPYIHPDDDPRDYYTGPNVNRGDSFVSSAMFV